MNMLKAISGSLLLLLVLLSCGKEQEGTSIAAQQTSISTYLDAVRAKDSTLGIFSVYDIYRVVLVPGNASKLASAGDSAIFYYKAGTFSQTAKDGFGQMFDTNIDTVAKNRKLDTTRVFAPYRAVVGSGSFIDGLEKGLQQMSEGERAQLIFTSDHGYGTDALGNVPKNTPLIFEVTMIEVKKK